MIIVTGLPRSGSMSVSKALGILGYKVLFYCPLTKQGGDWTLLKPDFISTYDVIVDWSLANLMDVAIQTFNPEKIIFLRRTIGWRESMDNLNVSPKLCDEFMNDAIQGFNLISTANFPYLTLDIIKNPRWNELCEFLGKPIPNIPFPHLNKSEFTYRI